MNIKKLIRELEERIDEIEGQDDKGPEDYINVMQYKIDKLVHEAGPMAFEYNCNAQHQFLVFELMRRRVKNMLDQITEDILEHTDEDGEELIRKMREDAASLQDNNRDMDTDVINVQDRGNQE